MTRSAVVLLLFAMPLPAQDGLKLDRPTSADYIAYNNLKYGRTPVAGDAEKKVIDKVVRYHVFQLEDPRYTSPDGQMNNAVREFTDKVILAPSRPEKQDEKRRAAADEIGAVAVGHIEKLVKNPKKIVQLNAARLLAEVGRTGYDGTAKLAVALINDEQVPDAVKFYAIQALGNLLAYVEDPALPDKSAFKRANRELEHESLKSLINYIAKKRDLTATAQLATRPDGDGDKNDKPAPKLDPEQIDAIRYIRREAVRALANSRAHTIRYQEKVVCRPALALLRVAANDGLVPEASLSERVDALVAFTQLYPVVRTIDRDIHLDYAAQQFALAIVDIANVQLNDPNAVVLPWKFSAARLEDGLQKWEKAVKDMRLDGADLVAELTARAKASVLDAMKSAVPGSPPNPGPLSAWAKEIKLKKGETLHDEPGTGVSKPKPADGQ